MSPRTFFRLFRETTGHSPYDRLIVERVAVTSCVRRGAAIDLSVDTTRRSVRDVLDTVLTDWQVADITVTDPPLEQVIAEVYTAAAP